MYILAHWCVRSSRQMWSLSKQFIRVLAMRLFVHEHCCKLHENRSFCLCWILRMVAEEKIHAHYRQCKANVSLAGQMMCVQHVIGITDLFFVHVPNYIDLQIVESLITSHPNIPIATSRNYVVLWSAMGVMNTVPIKILSWGFDSTMSFITHILCIVVNKWT